jgi:AraC family transcriptional activator of pobA
MKNIPVRHITKTSEGENIAASFNIRDVRDVLKGKDMTQELHRHDFFYVLVLKKGAGTHAIDFTSYKIADHTVFFIRPGQVHQLTLKAGSTGYLMAFNSDFYYTHDLASNQLLRKAGTINLYQLDSAGIKKVLSIVNYIWDEYTSQQEGYQEVIKANLGILFIELVRQNTHTVSGKSDSYAAQRLDDFTALLEEHIYTHKQVSQYADMLNLSSYQLNAITKDTLGKTGSEVITEYIILESKRYLLATSSQVNQIAYQLGYEDVSYFIRFFKKHTGYSPEAFRANFK